MTESRVGEFMFEVGRLKRDLKELRVELRQKQEVLTIMQALPAGDRRAQNTSTRSEVRKALRKFTQAFEMHLLPRLREQRVYAPAAWRASMEHLRNLASTDMSGREDVAYDTCDMFEQSLGLTYDPVEERDTDPFGFEFGMEFQGNSAFHAAWTALLTAVARHTQVLLQLYDPTSVDDFLLRHFEIGRDVYEHEVAALGVKIETCKEAIIRDGEGRAFRSCAAECGDASEHARVPCATVGLSRTASACGCR